MITKLKRIKKLLDEAERIFNTFSHQEQQAIFEFHNPEGSLPHCLRWSTQGIGELIEHHKELEKKVDEM